ncbi:hypothetical protein MUK42_08157 [Musa troglodytarum]|uniref:Uncharacterized protein n=1 Tax=Musa troglodytarum TaxID=320322 RepID=A0A9E7EF24_9LILI|nr:hypothetical protein MUK42_08157 [Musa troglodytarum]
MLSLMVPSKSNSLMDTSNSTSTIFFCFGFKKIWLLLGKQRSSLMHLRLDRLQLLFHSEHEGMITRRHANGSGHGKAELMLQGNQPYLRYSITWSRWEANGILPAQLNLICEAWMKISLHLASGNCFSSSSNGHFEVSNLLLYQDHAISQFAKQVQQPDRYFQLHFHPFVLLWIHEDLVAARQAKKFFNAPVQTLDPSQSLAYHMGR